MSVTVTELKEAHAPFVYINAAKQHGENENNHVNEIEGLQSFFLAAWGLLTPAQRLVFATRAPVVEEMMNAIGGIPAPGLVGEENLVLAFGEHGEHPDYPREDWQDEVSAGDTGRSYWGWVDSIIERETQDTSILL